jgi:peptidoglycan/LPS O-acetylase OafA/YrhL
MFSETKYRRDIQVLRGLAVLAVVLFHAKESYFPLGYLGVDVFFVISGFVVTPLILRIFTDQVNGGGHFSNLKSFYKRRFYRLVPALAVTLAISAISIFLFGPIGDHQRIARQGVATLLLVGNVGAYKYSGDYFSPNPNPLVHTWSLSVEEQIYIFLPLILMLILHNSRSLKSVTAVVLGFISAISFISFLIPTIFQSLYSRLGIDLASQFSFYSPIDRIWQFTLGGLAFLLLDRLQNRTGKIPKGIHSLGVIAVVMILFGPIHMSLKVSSFLASLFAVIVILSKSVDVLPNSLIQKLEWVGDRSYSIYLVHMPLLYLAKYSPGLGSGLSQKFLVIMMIFMSILLGHLQFELVEKKFRIRGRRMNPLPVRSILQLVIGFIGIPIVLFSLILASAQMDYKPILKNFVKGTKVDSHLLARAGCVDKVFNPSKCSWNVSQSKGSVLLLGDSQAYAAADGVQLAANKLQLNFLGVSASGCPFLQTDTTGDKPIDCLNFQSSILEYIQSAKPEYVIIANRTTGYLDPSAGWRTFLNSKGKPAKDETEASEIYAKKLFEISTKLNKLGAAVIIFQNIPEPSRVGNPQSIFQYIFLRDYYKNGVTSTLKLNTTARSIEESLAKKGLISLYDPSVEICGNSCSDRINIGDKYMDSWHLSTKESLNLSSSIESVIKKIHD